MEQVDALQMAENVRERLVDLAVSENFLRDEKLSNICRQIWSKKGTEGGLVSDLWVEGAFPGKESNDTLHTLTSEGIFPKDLFQHIKQRDVFPEDRRLYNHQSETIRLIAKTRDENKPSLIITAGTGLGKTEAFLLPMLMDLWNNPKRQKDGGMRCLILYPMNALVADQVTRVYNWLQDQEKLTVFHFTSETPENSRQADKQGELRWEPCRMRTRQEARGKETHSGKSITNEPFGDVPDIVITNYSMLEYMLCRPQDARFFGPDLRCIILDEAHLYSGTLAAEIMMLLRRVRERCNVKSDNIIHIGTSATLGGNEKQLQDFGSMIFSTKQENTYVIRGQYSKHYFGNVESTPSKPLSVNKLSKYINLDFPTFSSDEELESNNQELVKKLNEIIANLISKKLLNTANRLYQKEPAPFLYTTLQESPIIHRLADILSKEEGNILNLDKLAKQLFPDEKNSESLNTTILLLRLAAKARMKASDLPIIPHRLHFLARAPEGLSICLNKNCFGPFELHLDKLGCVQEIGDQCIYCNHILLPIHRCDNCGEWALVANENEEEFKIEPGYYAHSSKKRIYLLTTEQSNSNNYEEMVIDTENGEIRGHGVKGTLLWKAPVESTNSIIQLCPTCQSEWTKEDNGMRVPEWQQTCRRLINGRPFAISVIAETILNDLPPFQGPTKNWKPAEGRRLLCFSDSRRSAARLGPLLTQQHEMQVLRTTMVQCAKNLVPADTTMYLIGEIERIKKDLMKSGQSEGVKIILENKLKETQNQLLQSKVGTPFSTYVSLVAKRNEIKQIMDRTSAERHNSSKYGQSNWIENHDAIKKHLEALIASEFKQPIKKQTSVESVGLLEIVYPGIESLSIPPFLEEKLPSKEIRKTLNSIWPNFIALFLDSIRSDGCVDWSEKTEERQWLDESPLQGRWLTCIDRGWNSNVFVGATPRQLRRKFTINVLNSAKCPKNIVEELSEQVLRAVFNQLLQLANDKQSGYTWIKKEMHHQINHEKDAVAIQIIFDCLSIRVPDHLYQCEATKTIWTHEALGWVPVDGCMGTLNEVSPEYLNQDIRWGRARRDFLKSSIFKQGLWAEEHSAQLSPRENRRLQDLFKNGIRNILSSTTTMELGIDIGGLNGVLLSNVPPGPANHRQRAGRAGRRSDGSAVVVTFARSSEYDREVFKRFGDFIRQKLKLPTVFRDRKRIVQLHLHAVLLSEFLREMQPDRTGAMHAFGRMGQFCGIKPPLFWKKDSSNKPIWEEAHKGIGSQFSDLLISLKNPDTKLINRLSKLSKETGLKDLQIKNHWHHFISKAIDKYKEAINKWEDEINQLKEAWDDIPVNPPTNRGREKAKANSICYQVHTLNDITVIEWLANHRFLPRYGFPINLQQLTIRKAREGKQQRYASEPDERYRLERSSLLALNEYVPESKILVGGKIAISRGLKKHWTDNNYNKSLGLQYYALECENGHEYIKQSQNESCRCGASTIRIQQLVFPRYGFTTAAWEPIKRETSLERIGKQTICPIAFTDDEDGDKKENFANINGFDVIYKEEAPLLVKNSGRNGVGFAICTRCGFSISEKKNNTQGQMDLPKDFEKHASIFSINPKDFCWGKNMALAPVIRNKVLAAKEITDMLLIKWPGLIMDNPNGAYSLGRALIIAGARLLEIDERELGMEIIPCEPPVLGIVIFDTTPGGAGHCLELILLGRKWIEITRNVLYVNEEHHARCKRACLDCILGYSSQYNEYKLDRIKALQLIDSVI